MSNFFAKERWGKPRLIAGFLLACFLAQCTWLTAHAVHTRQADPHEMSRVQAGLRQWHGHGVAGTPEQSLQNDSNPEDADKTLASSTMKDGYDVHHSPFYYLIASAPLVLWGRDLVPESRAFWEWLARVPYIIVGLLLGASLWYVAHRLYGAPGGYVALSLYCFSPGIIRASALWFQQPEIPAVWGAFGSIFTAIALAHTLYAPREVVLWNWRRILLLGLSLAIAIGSQFSLVLLVPVVLVLFFYLVPERKQAALVIWVAACITAALLLFATYSFHAGVFWNAMRHADFGAISLPALFMAGNYRQLLVQISEASQALAFAIPAAILAYALWPRARYFGNTAPLILSALFLFLGLAQPHYPGLGFRIIALPILFLFVGGIFSDALDTSHSVLVQAAAWGLIAAYALWNLTELAKVSFT